MRILFALFAMLTVGAAAPDWTKAVRRAPNGAYVMGNPAAKVKLVEYLSYSCPHCAHFAGEASNPLKTYIAKGNVSVEFRNAVRDRYDFAAALLARCGGPAHFFPQSEAIFAAQDELLAKASAHEATSKLTEGTPVTAVLTDMADGSGLTDFMAARGVSAAAAKACLTDKAEQDAVLAMTKEAWQVRKIQGTPTFLLNGTSIGSGDWAMVDNKLRAAIARRR